MTKNPSGRAFDREGVVWMAQCMVKEKAHCLVLVCFSSMVAFHSPITLLWPLLMPAACSSWKCGILWAHSSMWVWIHPSRSCTSIHADCLLCGGWDLLARQCTWLEMSDISLKNMNKTSQYYPGPLISQTWTQLSICGTTSIVVFTLWILPPPPSSSCGMHCSQHSSRHLKQPTRIIMGHSQPV